jgi:galactokinase
MDRREKNIEENQLRNLTIIYPNSGIAQQERFKILNDIFQQAFGESPSYYIKCSARVNLIGEYIDQSGYPIMASAIERDTVLAVGLTQATPANVHLVNLNHDFEPSKFEYENLGIDNDWTKYFKNSYKVRIY